MLLSHFSGDAGRGPSAAGIFIVVQASRLHLLFVVRASSLHLVLQLSPISLAFGV
jgi:hypothetical protein